MIHTQKICLPSTPAFNPMSSNTCYRRHFTCLWMWVLWRLRPYGGIFAKSSGGHMLRPADRSEHILQAHCPCHLCPPQNAWRQGKTGICCLLNVPSGCSSRERRKMGRSRHHTEFTMQGREKKSRVAKQTEIKLSGLAIFQSTLDSWAIWGLVPNPPQSRNPHTFDSLRLNC